MLAFAEHSDRISTWVASEVVLTRSPALRATVLAHFIELADHCRLLHNYNGLLEIFNGLLNANVVGLKAAWDALPRRARDRFDALLPLAQLQRNRAVYRDEFARCARPAIPFFGCLLCDLAMHGQASLLTDAGGPSFAALERQREAIGRIYAQVLACKRVPYPLKRVPVLQRYLERGLLVVPRESLSKFARA